MNKNASSSEISTEAEFLNQRAQVIDLVIGGDLFPCYRFTDGKTGRTIDLLTMVHVAPADFYRQRMAQVAEARAAGHAIHHETVRMKAGEAPSLERQTKSVYRILARLMDFELQPLPRLDLGDEIHDAVISDLPLGSRLRLTALMTAFSLLKRQLEKQERKARQDGTILKLQGRALSLYRNTILQREDSNKESSLPLFLVDVPEREEIAVAAAVKTNREEERNATLLWGVAHVDGITALLEAKGYVRGPATFPVRR